MTDVGFIDLSSYKHNLLRDICNCESIVEFIDSQNPSVDKEDNFSLIYQNVFPYLRIPSTQTKADAYVLLGVSKVNVNRHNHAYHDIEIVIWCLAHQERMQVKGKNGTRIDLLSNEVERLLEGTTKYGFNRLELISSKEIVLDPIYLYRDLIFRTNDLKHPVSMTGR